MANHEATGVDLSDSGIAARISDPDRIAAVLATQLLDTDRDDAFDSLAATAVQLLDLDGSFVTLVDEERVFIKSVSGSDYALPVAMHRPITESHCQWVVGTGSIVTIDDVREEPWVSAVDMSSFDILAWAGAPIFDPDGRVIGVLCVVDVDTREWSQTDRVVLEAVARAVSAEMRLWSRLREIETAKQRTDHLVALARGLATAHTTAEVTEVVIELGGAVLECDIVSFGTLEPGASVLELQFTRQGVEVDKRFALLRDGLVTVPLTAELPIVQALVRGEMLVLDPTLRTTEYAYLNDSPVFAGLQWSISVPMFNQNGVAIGALAVAWAQLDRVDDELIALVQAVADMCAQTLERSNASDTSKKLLTAMTLEVLPAVPDVPGLDVAVRYLPAHDQLAFGGDWYDVIPMSETEVVFVVGDVVGHGIEAAARMAQIRGVVNTLVQQSALAGDLLDQADRLLTRLDDPLLATVAIMWIDLSAGRLRYVSAGHPPFILVGSGGEVAMLDRGKRPPLGMGGVVADVPEIDFRRSDTLVAFTDGLIERRGENLDVGLDGAAAVTVEHRALSASDIADLLIERATGETMNQDDIALVVLQRVD